MNIFKIQQMIIAEIKRSIEDGDIKKALDEIKEPKGEVMCVHDDPNGPPHPGT